MDRIILIVDDDLNSLRLAKNILRDDYRIAAASSGEMVFTYLEKNRPDLILLDVNMPDMDGFAVMKKISQNPRWNDIAVIFLTADQDPQIEARCLEMGAIDFVSKPFVPLVLKRRIEHTLERMDYRSHLEQMVREQAEEILNRTTRIANIQETVILGMANLIDLRDNSTGRHVKNTKHYVEMICDALIERHLYPGIMTEEYRRNAIKAAPLHDVGKIRIPDAILRKPAKLTEEEFKEIQKHAVYGAEIIDDILGEVEESDYLSVAREIAMHHHERWDGTGYPSHLAGENIPLCARIMAVADVFDALYEDRVYRKGMRSLPVVLSIIEDGKGTQFDPVLVDVFMSLEDKLRRHVGEDNN